MARASENTTVMQVAVPRDLDAKLTNIASKTHVPKSVIVRMGIEKILKMIDNGEVKLGISFE